MSMTKHAPLPWFLGAIEKGTVVRDDKYGTVIHRTAGTTCQFSQQDLELIVLSCNAHDDLLTALKAIEECTRLVPDSGIHGDNRMPHARMLAQAAIAKAEKGVRP